MITPCVICGFSYPWEGSPTQVQRTTSHMQGLCPACFLGYAPPVGAPGHEPGGKVPSTGRGFRQGPRRKPA